MFLTQTSRVHISGRQPKQSHIKMVEGEEATIDGNETTYN